MVYQTPWQVSRHLASRNQLSPLYHYRDPKLMTLHQLPFDRQFRVRFLQFPVLSQHHYRQPPTSLWRLIFPSPPQLNFPQQIFCHAEGDAYSRWISIRPALTSLTCPSTLLRQTLVIRQGCLLWQAHVHIIATRPLTINPNLLLPREAQM